MEISAWIGTLLRGGLGNLAAYLAAHVLLCLVPAFFVAGALTALIPKAAVTRHLGRSAPKALAYPMALAAGSVLAVCSCTVVPLFAGVYRKGAGLGPAIAIRAASRLGVDAQVSKVTTYDEILKYPILSTPGLVINEQLVCSGRVPSESEVDAWLAEAAREG